MAGRPPLPSPPRPRLPSSPRLCPIYESIESAMLIARVALEIRRYEDLVEAMESVAMMSGKELPIDARILLDLGYRNVMEAKRNDRRALETIHRREAEHGTIPHHFMWIFDYVSKVEAEMDKICSRAKSIIDEHVLSHATSPEDQVFYIKLLGDLYMYRCELKVGQGWKEAASASFDEYQRAEVIALQDLPGNSPLRLNLAVSFSTLSCNQILTLPERALDIIKTGVDAALSSPGELDEACMQLVKILDTARREMKQINGENADGGEVPHAYEGK